MKLVYDKTMIQEIKQRRSIRKYKNKVIDQDLIMDLLESARLAPSGNNTQPWQFIVIKDDTIRQQVMEVCNNQIWMMSAPVFIVCLADTRARMKEERFKVNENSAEMDVKRVIRDTSIAVEHIVLEAESMGLGTCWIGWYEQDDVRSVLDIPETHFVLSILTVGYPDHSPAAKSRKEMEEILYFEKWNLSK